MPTPAGGLAARNLPDAEPWAEAIARRWAPVTVLNRHNLQVDDRDLTAPAAAKGDQRPAWLARCYQGLHLALIQPRPQALAEANRQVTAMQSVGFARGQRLAEVALGVAMLRTPGQGQAVLDLLRAHGTPESDARPAIERIWTDRTVVTAALECGQLELALQTALQARELATTIADPLIHTLADWCLQFALLAAGNTNDALVVLRQQRRRLEAVGVPINRMWAYNVGLAELLQGQPSATLATLAELNHVPGAPHPVMRSLLQVLEAAALAATGDVARALLLIQDADFQPLDQEAQASLNRLWLAAQVHLLAEQPAQALALLRAGLDADDACPAGTSPLNGTQLQRALSQACEALGDEAAALRALKRSQRHCEIWVGQSVRSRLMAQLYADPADGARLQSWLQTLDRALTSPSPSVSARSLPATPAIDPVRHVAEAAHEFRNPLNGVIGFTSLLALSELNERQRTYAQGAQTSAQMLLRLCNQLLDVSALEAGQFRPRLAEVDIRALAREVVAVLQPLAEARARLSLRVDCDACVPARLLLDGARLQQILMNLLGNALKFTEAGEVVLSLHWQPEGALRLTVRDTGCGFEPHLLEHLFGAYNQANRQDARGTGLGLAISRRIARALGGDLTGHSQPRVGSCFELRLPASVEGRPPVPPGTAESARPA